MADAARIKAVLESLGHQGLKMDALGPWVETLKKYSEFETAMTSVTAQYPKAKEVANNPNITPGPAFKQFQELQQKALKLKQELKGPVETLEKGRQNLYEQFKKHADKKKGEVWKNQLQGINTQFNFMLVSVRQTSEELGSLTPKPRATAPAQPKAAPASSTVQYAKTPGSVPAKPAAPSQYAKTPGNVKG